MQKWNLLKKTAPCILSLAVAATTFPTAVMASDFDAAVVSEAEAGDTEDFSTEETAEDTEAVAEESCIYRHNRRSSRGCSSTRSCCRRDRGYPAGRYRSCRDSG